MYRAASLGLVHFRKDDVPACLADHLMHVMDEA
jgi:hypothetical protein